MRDESHPNRSPRPKPTNTNSRPGSANRGHLHKYNKITRFSLCLYQNSFAYARCSISMYTTSTLYLLGQGFKTHVCSFVEAP